MKRSGSRWKELTGAHIVHLRALALSDRWDDGITLALSELRTPVRAAACSAHSTLRVIVYDETEVAQVRARFKELGCSTELSHIPGLVAIDVPPAVPLEALKPILDEGRAQERWDYEEACLAER